MTISNYMRTIILLLMTSVMLTGCWSILRPLDKPTVHNPPRENIVIPFVTKEVSEAVTDSDFEALDVDEDGVLSKKEIKRLAVKQKKSPWHDANNVFLFLLILIAAICALAGIPKVVEKIKKVKAAKDKTEVKPVEELIVEEKKEDK